MYRVYALTMDTKMEAGSFPSFRPYYLNIPSLRNQRCRLDISAQYWILRMEPASVCLYFCTLGVKQRGTLRPNDFQGVGMCQNLQFSTKPSEFELNGISFTGVSHSLLNLAGVQKYENYLDRFRNSAENFSNYTSDFILFLSNDDYILETQIFPQFPISLYNCKCQDE